MKRLIAALILGALIQNANAATIVVHPIMSQSAIGILGYEFDGQTYNVSFLRKKYEELEESELLFSEDQTNAEIVMAELAAILDDGDDVWWVRDPSDTLNADRFYMPVSLPDQNSVQAVRALQTSLDWYTDDYLSAVPVPTTVTYASLQAVPVPAAVWLFGSALGLLACMRRKSVLMSLK
jgi:hypothetical protein